MRRRNLRFGRLLAAAFLALAAARPATGQPCTITCQADVTVTATGVLTPVPFTFPVLAGSCGGSFALTTCSVPNGGNFPLGTTTVTCSVNPPSGGPVVCQFDVNVVAPTDPGVTFTEFPVIHPFPGTNVNTGASFGQFDVLFNFFGTTKQFLVFDNGVYVSAVDAQGFTAFNCAPIDVGVKCIGQAASGQSAAAQIKLCGGDIPPTVTIHAFADQSLNLSQGVFLNGGTDGVLCGETPADKRAFNLGTSDEPFFVPLLPGATATEVFVTPDACATLTSGSNGLVLIPKNGGPSTLRALSFRPAGGTAADDGNYWMSDALTGELVKVRVDGTEAGRFPLGKALYRMSTLSAGEVAGWSPPRTFVVYNPTFNLGASHVFLGTASDIVDIKPIPGFLDAFSEFHYDAAARQSFIRWLRVLRREEVRRGWWATSRRVLPENCLRDSPGR